MSAIYPVRVQKSRNEKRENMPADFYKRVKPV